MAFVWSAVLAAASQGPEPTAASAACDCQKDCGNVKVVWLRESGTQAGIATGFEGAVDAALRNVANWSVETGGLEPGAELPLDDKPGGGAAFIHLLSCRSADCVSRAAAGGYVVLNVRLLARPLYVFLRDGLDLQAASQLKTAITSEATSPLPRVEMESLLAELLHKPVSLKTYDRAELLASRLSGKLHGTDAVVIVGDGPSDEMEDLLGWYEKEFGGQLHPSLLVAGFPRASFGSFTTAGQAQVRYVRLEYPRDAFYWDLRTTDGVAGEGGPPPGTAGDRVPATVGIAPLAPASRETWPPLPVLFTDATAAGGPPSCCLQALRRAVGGAALLMAGAGAASLERTLLTYALLASRARGEPMVGQLLCAGALAGYLTGQGDAHSARSARSVLRSVGQRDYGGVSQGIRGEMAALDAASRRRIREQFSRDVAGLVAPAPRTLQASLALAPKDVQDAAPRLLNALRAEPAPAKRKAGGGMTHADDYNPYLNLAQFWMLHRAELTVQPGAPPRRAANLGDPGAGDRFSLVAAVIGIATTGGPSVSEARGR